jgi:hypothetical protein
MIDSQQQVEKMNGREVNEREVNVLLLAAAFAAVALIQWDDSCA